MVPFKFTSLNVVTEYSMVTFILWSTLPATLQREKAERKRQAKTYAFLKYGEIGMKMEKITS